MWTLCIGSSLVFGPILGKTWRLYRVFTQRVPDKRVVSCSIYLCMNRLWIIAWYRWLHYSTLFACVSDYKRHPADGFGCSAGPSGCCCSSSMGSDGSHQVLSLYQCFGEGTPTFYRIFTYYRPILYLLCSKMDKIIHHYRSSPLCAVFQAFFLTMWLFCVRKRASFTQNLFTFLKQGSHTSFLKLHSHYFNIGGYKEPLKEWLMQAQIIYGM